LDYFIKDITEKELVKILNSKDYFAGDDSNWGFETDEHGKKVPFLYKNRERIARRFAVFANMVYKLNMKKVLEIGCGLGFLLHELQERNIDAIGIDVSEWAIRHAMYAPWDLHMIVASGANLPFKDKSFDLVFSMDVLEHIPSTLIPQLIADCSRVGRFNLHLISVEPLDRDKDKTHVTMMPIEWWRKDLPPDFLIAETYGTWSLEVKGRVIHSQRKEVDGKKA